MGSSCNAFFQPLLPDFLSSFSIPESFLKKLEPELINGHQLKRLFLIRDKKQWAIDVEEGCHFNARDWNKFAQEYDLKVGGFIVFRHLGNLVFQAFVFDPTTSCDTLSHKFTKPSKLLQPKQQNQQQQQDEDEEEETGGGAECYVTVTSYFVRRNIINVPRQFVREKGLELKRCEVTLIDQNKRRWKVSLNYKESNGQSYFDRGCKAFMVANQINPGNVIKLQLVNGGNNPIFKCCIPSARQPAQDVLPSCDLTVYSHAVLKGAVYLPRQFARENELEFRQCDVTLIDEHNRSWKAWLHYQDSSGQSSITRGWKAFLAGNCLKSGDVVRLQLLNAGKHPRFKCYSCPKPNPKPKVGKEDIVVPCPSRRRRRMLPSCHLKITSHVARRNTVYLPMKLAKQEELVGRSCDVTVIDKKRRSWKMKLHYYKSSGRSYVSQGWKEFQDANHIKVGDTIRIQLLHAGDYPVFKCWRPSRGRKSNQLDLDDLHSFDF